MPELKLNSAVYGVKKSGIREFMALARRTPGCISLTIGEPDFVTPGEIRAEAKDSLDAGDTHYIENNGARFLREAIAEFEAGRGLSYSPEEIIVTAGATEGIFAALFCMLEPGDEVIVPTPAFGLYEAVIRLCRGVFVPVDTRKNGFQLAPELLDAAISERTKAIILNSPNNPTGCVYNAASLRAVRERVQNTGIFVLCDDVYRELTYAPGFASFAEFSDMRERAVVIQSFSKPYAMTGWRAGYLMADAPVKAQIEKAHQYMMVSTASFIQRACGKALRYDPADMIAEYKKRRDYACDRLAAMGLDFVPPQGAFYVFPEIEKFGAGSLEFCTRLVNEGGLALTPGLSFGADSHARLSYCYDMQTLRAGLDRLEAFISKI